MLAAYPPPLDLVDASMEQELPLLRGPHQGDRLRAVRRQCKLPQTTAIGVYNEHRV
jgi:hypothetical protein